MTALERTGAGGDNVRLAVATILGTVLALSLGDALIKLMSAGFGLWQIFVLRSMIALPLLVIAIRWIRPGAVPLVPRALGWTALRSVMLLAMWVAYYAALPHIPLSVAAATYYTLPIFITLFAALLVGERVGAKAWAAVAVGFLGVLLILRPRAEDFSAYALLPLVSAMLYALAMILTRTRCRTEHPLTLSLALNAGFVATGLVATAVLPAIGDEASFLSGAWTPMGGIEWAAMAVLAAAILIGSIGAAVAYQAAPSSIVGTFDFAYVGFATVWGLVFFAEVPDALTLAGMAMIVGAGILTVRRGPGEPLRT
ncbi:MAG TPA: DMT family transporter [Thermohalobaculum sp.]|nr:DMT family transporter [Thermohalobaculum sp.]